MKNLKTTSKKVPVKSNISKSRKPKTIAVLPLEVTLIPCGDISFNPQNHRQLYSETAIQAFAGEIALHGIISPLTVRPLGEKYELVVGERRLRAALTAGLTHVPAIVKDYDDAEVNEIQLAENLQREDPHPLHIAHAIRLMKDSGKTIDEVSLRLGKSTTFVYARLKLLNLIEKFQEVFLSDKITTNDAFQIASLSSAAQEEFFAEYFEDWQSNPNFSPKNIENQLKRYRSDLRKAPFDTGDKTLLPEAGACSNCIYNSAYLQTLFPELSKDSHCTHNDCYFRKTNADFRRKLDVAVQEFRPAAFIVPPYISEHITSILAEYPGISTVNWHEARYQGEPQPPDREDYEDDEDMEDEDDEEIDCESADGRYARAMERFHELRAEFLEEVESGEYQKGLLVEESSVRPCHYTIGKDIGQPGKQTAKDVQDAIKNKTVTPEMLQIEIERLDQRETRAKELDIKKIRTDTYENYTSHIAEQGPNAQMTQEDILCMRLLVYESLDFQSRQRINEILNKKSENIDEKNDVSLHTALGLLSEAEFCFMIRMALSCSMNSRYLEGSAAHFIRQAAIACGVDVAGIELAQQEITDARTDRLATRKHELTRMKERLERKRTA